MTIVSYNGQDVDFDDAAAQMDPALREIVKAELGESSEQELIDSYAAAHLAVYGEDFYAP
jgi:Anti-CRISPR protein AcrIC5